MCSEIRKTNTIWNDFYGLLEKYIYSLKSDISSAFTALGPGNITVNEIGMVSLFLEFIDWWTSRIMLYTVHLRQVHRPVP